MKKARFNRFTASFQTHCTACLFGPVSLLLLSSPAFAVTTTGVTNTYNGSLAANGLGSGTNWTAGSPFSGSGAGAYADLVFTGADTGSTFTASGGASTFMNAESFNVTDGNSYTLQINSTTAARFNVGTTPNELGNGESILPFTNSVSGVAQDLIFLSGGSDLTFNATNANGGSAATLPIRQAGNFNIGTDSVLTIHAGITGTAAVAINGTGTTVFSGTNTYSGALTMNGGTFEISGTYSGTGAITHTNGLSKISGTRSGTGATTLRNGTLEISGTNAGTAYTVTGTVDGSEPVLKLSNLTALPLGAKITGADSTLRDGIVDLAVAGSYILSSHERGNITYTTSSGSPTTLTFTDASKVTAGLNSVRTFNNGSPDLSVVFSSTLDIGGDVATNVNINGSGNTTVTGGILSTGTAARGLSKGGSGTLALNGPGAYAGSTRISGGMLILGNALAIPGGIGATGGTSNIVFAANTAVIGLTTASGNFLRTVGPGADQVTANPTADPDAAWRMGFAAFGGDRLVNFGAPITLSSTSYAGAGLVLGANTADSKVTVVNDIDLASSSRTVFVHDGSTAVDGELSGTITSAAATLVKSGDGTLKLSGANTYGSAGGGTEVLAGVLVVEEDSLSVTSKLVINGGKVEPVGTVTVDTLFFGEEQKIAGTWGSTTSSAAPEFQDERFSGTGLVVVTTNPAAGFTGWAEDNAGGQTADLDFDNDGVSNGVEYFMGETGSTFTPNPGVIVDKVTWPRDPDAVATFKVQVSDTLAPGGWTDIVPPHLSIDETDPNEVVFSLPSEGPRNFCRLVVTP